MNYFFSKASMGFYTDEIHGKNIPEDSVSISNTHYRELMDGQARGLKISNDSSGFPVLIQDDIDFRILCSRERSWRNQELQRADIELYKVQDSDPSSTASVADWRTYRKFLRAWPEDSNFPNTTFRPLSPDVKE